MACLLNLSTNDYSTLDGLDWSLYLYVCSCFLKRVYADMLWTGALKEMDMQLVLLGWVIYHSKLLTTELLTRLAEPPRWTMNRGAKSTHHNKPPNLMVFIYQSLMPRHWYWHWQRTWRCESISCSSIYPEGNIYVLHNPYICPLHRITVWPANRARLVRTKAAWDDTYHTGTSRSLNREIGIFSSDLRSVCPRKPSCRVVEED